MEKSLQTSLLNLIRENYPNPVGIDRLYLLCEMLNHKQSTCDRKCRVLTHAGLIKPLKTDKGAINAYKALGWTNENIAEVFGNLKRKIEVERGKFLGLDENLKPIYKKDTLKEKIQNPLFKFQTPF